MTNPNRTVTVHIGLHATNAGIDYTTTRADADKSLRVIHGALTEGARSLRLGDSIVVNVAHISHAVIKP